MEKNRQTADYGTYVTAIAGSYNSGRVEQAKKKILIFDERSQ
jgi:hypothetical protein